MMSPQIKKVIAINVAILLMVIAVTNQTSLLVNESESLNGKVFLLVKTKHFEKGSLVGIKDFSTIYSSKRHLTKKIIGMPGDQIAVFNNKIFINGSFQCFTKKKTKDGEPLHPITAQLIPKDHYFVIAEHKDSFDSRYQEFGLVGAQSIEGKAYRIW